MSINYASQARLSISSRSQGNKRLKEVKSSSVSGGGSTETVNTVGEDEPQGFKRTPGGITITLTVCEVKGKPEVDYPLLEKTQEIFAFTREVVGGRRIQYPECVVSKSGDISDDSDGEHTYDVEIVTLAPKPL